MAAAANAPDGPVPILRERSRGGCRNWSFAGLKILKRPPMIVKPRWIHMPAQKTQTAFQFYETVLQGAVRPVLREVL
jgi:hypothetical protein